LPFIDALHPFIDALYPFIDELHPFIDALHPFIDEWVQFTFFNLKRWLLHLKRPFATLQIKDFMPVEFPKKNQSIKNVSLILYYCIHEKEINKGIVEEKAGN